MNNPPLLESTAYDPVLSRVKLIAVTVHVGLRTCCADRRLNWASEQKSHRRRRFSWIFACCCERVNSNVGRKPHKEKGVLSRLSGNRCDRSSFGARR